MAAEARSLRVPSFVTFFNPLAQRVLGAGAFLGPNALLTVRGRKSGVMRTTPVALVAIDGRRWVIGTFGEVNWVRNLRAAGEATLSVGKLREEVHAVELDEESRAAFFRDSVGPYVRHLRVGGLILGLLGAREVLDDPSAAARTRPVFELIR
jgi:deazaflavin-dependent oxidoreductase (nitroreductase family)